MSNLWFLCLHDTQDFTYNLTARDSKNSTQTTVIVQVLDVNDNPPKFDQASITVTNITEQDKNVPQVLRYVSTPLAIMITTKPGTLLYPTVFRLIHIFS